MDDDGLRWHVDQPMMPCATTPRGMDLTHAHTREGEREREMDIQIRIYVYTYIHLSLIHI